MPGTHGQHSSFAQAIKTRGQNILLRAEKQLSEGAPRKALLEH